MSLLPRRLSQLLASMVLAVVLVSCSDRPSEPSAPVMKVGGPSMGYAPVFGCDNLTPATMCEGTLTTQTVAIEQLRVCKVYANGSSGPDAIINLTADYVQFQRGPQSGTYPLSNAECRIVWRNGEYVGTVRSTDVITVSETPVPGFTTKIQVTTILRDQELPGGPSTFTTTVDPLSSATSYTANVGGRKVPGALVVFINTPIPPNQHPHVNANGPYVGVEGSTVTFSSAGTSDPEGDPLTYLWDFGDGITSTTQNPVHTYADNGVYPVTLTVNDGNGPQTVNTTSTISNVPPVPTAGVANGSLACGELAQFTGTFTDAGVIDQTWTWAINWGDGSPNTTGGNATMAAPITATHSYGTNTGPKTITLTVTDKDGGVGTATTTEINNCRPNQEPVPQVNGPYVKVEGSTVTFNTTGTIDPDGDVLTYSWTFGDGGTGTGPNPTHVYADNGVYPVTLTVTDGINPPVVINTTATIANLPPVPTLATSTPSVSCGQTGYVTATFTDPGVIDNLWSYDIDWGDASANTTGTTTTQAGTISGSHIYGANGTYTVTIVVTDKDGATGTATTTIVRNCTPPPPVGPSCTYTQGYWKNHEEAWPAPYSPTAQWLDATHKVTGVTWDGLMGMSVKSGNSYMQLAHQWIAAKLNVGGNATSGSATVDATLSAAGAWLLANTPNNAGAVPNFKNAQATAWASTLDDYNNGRLGLPHCN